MTEKEFSRRAMAMAPRLHRISYLILGREADCEDAVQEALMRAWLHISSLRDEALFETWLIRILINQSRTLLRRRISRGESELTDSLPAPEPPDPALKDALMKLADSLRVPLILHHLEGYKVQEIADMLRLPQSTVKYRLRRGRETLKSLIEMED